MAARLLALGLLVVGPLAGCARGGIDNDLADDWPALSAPKVFTPAAGVCHSGAFAETGPASGYETVDCAQPHRTETAHVGTFRGEHGEGVTPPLPGSPAVKAAYGECEQAARDYLGGDWRAGRLWLGVTVPSATGWTGGARWFRCQLMEIVGKDDETVKARVGSLRDGLRSLAFGCYQVTSKDDVVSAMVPLDCTASHNAEFVGVHVPPDAPYAAPDDARWKAYHAACRGLIATYVGISEQTAKEAGSVASPSSKAEWERGNRGVRCHVWLETGTTTGTLKGLGSLPG